MHLEDGPTFTSVLRASGSKKYKNIYLVYEISKEDDTDQAWSGTMILKVPVRGDITIKQSQKMTFWKKHLKNSNLN